MKRDELFRKKSMERVASPDRLNDYIRVSSVSVWMILAAVFILTAAAACWAFMGRIPTTVETVGYEEEGNIICFVEPDRVRKLEAGTRANIDGIGEGEVIAVNQTPLSKRELTQMLPGDYYVSAIGPAEWNCMVTIRPERAPDAGESDLYGLVLTADEERPIDLIFD